MRYCGVVNQRSDGEVAPPWGVAWTRRIGRTLRKARSSLGLSAQSLSDRTRELGFEVPRNTIANLENGRRKDSISVQEIAVLAYALGVPPLVLLFEPLGDEVEVLPGVMLEQFMGAEWFSANRDMDGKVTFMSLEPMHPLDSALRRWREYRHQEAMLAMDREQLAFFQAELAAREAGLPSRPPESASPAVRSAWQRLKPRLDDPEFLRTSIGTYEDYVDRGLRRLAELREGIAALGVTPPGAPEGSDSGERSEAP